MAARAVETLGGHVFRRESRVVEVVLNRTKVADADLSRVAEFSDLTDLSLEETGIGDAGLAHLAELNKLEWLNLYRSQIGDAGLKHLYGMPDLRYARRGGDKCAPGGTGHIGPSGPG